MFGRIGGVFCQSKVQGCSSNVTNCSPWQFCTGDFTWLSGTRQLHTFRSAHTLLFTIYMYVFMCICFFFGLYLLIYYLHVCFYMYNVSSLSYTYTYYNYTYGLVFDTYRCVHIYSLASTNPSCLPVFFRVFVSQVFLHV